MKRHFAVVITSSESTKLTSDEIESALIALVNAKANKETPKPYFEVKVVSHNSEMQEELRAIAEKYPKAFVR